MAGKQVPSEHTRSTDLAHARELIRTVVPNARRVLKKPPLPWPNSR